MSITHPDMIKEMSLVHEQEDDCVILMMDCATPDLADDLFEIVARAIREGTVSFGGVVFSATKLKEG